MRVALSSTPYRVFFLRRTVTHFLMCLRRPTRLTASGRHCDPRLHHTLSLHALLLFRYRHRCVGVAAARTRCQDRRFHSHLSLPNHNVQPSSDANERDNSHFFCNIPFFPPGYGKELIKDTNIEFTIGRRYGLIGSNGSGKSSFLKCLAEREVPIPDHSQ